jgi:hypothetical protein
MAEPDIPGAKRTDSTLMRDQVDRRVFASSIDLDVEFQPVAFRQFAHA